MSLPWSSKGLKTTPVGADEILLLDSADANPATKNKRALLSSLPGTEVFTWTNNHSMATFSLTAGAGNDVKLDAPLGQSLSVLVNAVEEYSFSSTQADFKNNNLVNVGAFEINNPANTFQYQITGAAITADRSLALPLLTAGDTFVTEDFAQTLTNKTITAAANTLTIASTDLTDSASIARSSNNLGFFSATTSAQLLGVMSDETGTGSLVFATSPTLVTPALGTPSSGTLTNCTGLPPGGVVGTAATLGANTFTGDQEISKASALLAVKATNNTTIPATSLEQTGSVSWYEYLTTTTGNKIIEVSGASSPGSGSNFVTYTRTGTSATSITHHVDTLLNNNDLDIGGSTGRIYGNLTGDPDTSIHYESANTWDIVAGGTAYRFNTTELNTFGRNINISSSGTLTVDGATTLNSTLNVVTGTLNASQSIELGNTNAASTTASAFIDFKINDGDFDARLIRDAGTNGEFDIDNLGTGAITLRVNSTTRMQVGNAFTNHFNDFLIQPTQKFRLDGNSGGNTHLSESSADVATLTAGAVPYNFSVDGLAFGDAIGAIFGGSTDGEIQHNSSFPNTLDILTASTARVRFENTKITALAGVHFTVQPTEHIALDNDGDTYLVETGANIMSFFTGGTERFRINSDGSLGIPENAAFKLDGVTTAGDTFFASPTADTIHFTVGGQLGLRLIELGTEVSTVIGKASALATTATDGFLYVPTSAGAPTGVPTANTGKVANEFDTTNNTIEYYNSGWKGVAVAGFDLPNYGQGAPVLQLEKGYDAELDKYNETFCPLCKKQMKPNEAFALVGDSFKQNGNLHTYAAHLKCLIKHEGIGGE